MSSSPRPDRGGQTDGGDGIELVRERLIEAEAARWRVEAALADAHEELERVLKELERVLNSRAYRYLMRPAQRAAGVIRRPPRPALPPASRVRSQDVGPEDEANSFEDSVEDGSTAPPLRYHIHGPEAGQEVEEDLVVTVAGWVFAEESPVARVEIWADGVYVANARLGIASPDAADELDRPDAYLSGFESLVDVSDRAPGGASTFDIWVVTLDGRRYRIFSVTVRLPGDGRVPSRLPRVTPRGDVRLLVFTHDLGLGGAQLYLFELLRQLAKGSDFSAVVVSHTDGALREPTEALGIPVVVTGAQPVATEERYERRQQELEHWARAAGFNVVLANTLVCHHGVDVASRLGIPAVWAIHDSLELPVFWRVAYGSARAVDPRVRRQAEAAFASAAAVVFVADATRDLLAPLGDPRRFLTIPYGIRFEEIDSFAASASRADARRRLGLPADATVFISVGTIEPRKAQTVLVQAFGLELAAHPNTLLAFVGARTDWFTMHLRKYIRGAGLSSRVHVESVTSDVYWWFRAADAFVCASDVESLPRTVLEAMAFSVPVIATRIFGLPELIEDGVTGYLCEARDLKALADALERFLNTSPSERAGVAAAAARRVREKHDSRGYALAYDLLLRRLVEDPAVLPDEALTSAAPASLRTS